MIGFTVVFGGKQGSKVEVRGDRRKGGFLLAGGYPVKLLVKLPDKTREVCRYHPGNTF
jgi:hypothetical protein